MEGKGEGSLACQVVGVNKALWKEIIFYHCRMTFKKKLDDI